jgi:hypothetical protein
MERIVMNWFKESRTSIGKKEAVRWVRLKLIGLQPKRSCARASWLQELSSGQTRTCTPDWQLFRDGCRIASQIRERADRVLERVCAVTSNVLLFSDGHLNPVLATRWLELSPGSARR